jgi:hypothetical protein
MRPHQFRWLRDFLNASFGTLSREVDEATKKQENTVTEAAKTANEERNKIPGVIARIAAAIEATNADIEGYNKPQRKKEYRLQRWALLPAWITAVATTSAFIAAGIYACIANRQLNKMDDTYKEIRWQTYYSCLNAQAAQSALAQLQINAADTYSATAATIQQAAAGVESQRSYISFDFRFPTENEVFNNQLDIPFSLKNGGKSSTGDLDGWFTAVLLKNDESLTFTQKLNRVTTPNFRIDAGQEIPGKRDPQVPQFYPPTPYIVVYDSSGRTIPGTSQAASNFLHATSSDTVFVYGHFQYSDFAGVHRIRFCHPVYATQANASHHTTAQEEVCEKRSKEDDSYSGMPKMISPSPPTAKETETTVCKKPED